MKVSISSRCATTMLCLVSGALFSTGAAGQAAQPGSDAGTWQVTATIYAWVPTIDGTVNYPGDNGSTNMHVSMSDVLGHLKMTFQGSVDVHNGRWGIFNDIVYVDLGGDKSKSRDFSIGDVEIPATATADLSLDIKSLIVTAAGEYRVASDPAWTVDLLGGARHMRMNPTLKYKISGDLGSVVVPDREGRKHVNEGLWDGIVGVKGVYAFGDDSKWSLPFYLDVGTGESQLTWQISAGIGYSYNWGSMFATWRYLDYKFQSGMSLDDISMNGPMLGVALRW